jgi:L-aspartate oxidase
MQRSPGPRRGRLSGHAGDQGSPGRGSKARQAKEANTYYAQGGIIHRGPSDSADLLAEDILRAGAGLGSPEAVRILAEEGPARLKELLLDDLDVPFARQDDGSLDYTREAAHSAERILYVGDATGRAIEEALIGRVEEMENICLLTRHTAVDLLTPAHHSRNPLDIYEPLSCIGAYIFDQETRRVETCLAKATLLATGGLGQIFLHTTNPLGSRGDGLAMAHRAGARIINAEYVQFHPTSFFHRDAPVFLISEALRGEGAILLNGAGERFMVKYAPEWRELAPRDVVARGIHHEMLETGADHVYLDLASVMEAEHIRERFPTIYAKCLELDIDITKELIPVVPAAHYFCGGVWVDSTGRTSIDKLYAAGEVSCTGVHGANRLGSSSLLEGLVWGRRAAEDMILRLPELVGFRIQDVPDWDDSGLHETSDPALISQDMSTIKNIMWNYVGLVRTTHRLERALGDLRDLATEIDKFYRRVKLSDALIGLRNSVQAAILVCEAAWANRNSRGCHYRES